MLVFLVLSSLIFGLVASSIKTSSFTSFDDSCTGSWDIMDTFSLESKSIECAVKCLARSQMCDGVRIGKENDTCQMVQFSENVVCYKQFHQNNNKRNLLIGDHNVGEIKKKTFLVVPHTGAAYSIGNLTDGGMVETIPIPNMVDISLGLFESGPFGPATKYKNGFVSCLGWTDTCFYWDIATDFWDPFPSLREPHGNGGLLVVDGNLMVFGGQNGHGAFTKGVEVFNEDTGQWEPGVNLPVAISAMVVKLIDPKTIIVIGGRGDENRKIYRFVAGETQWTTLKELPFLIFNQISLAITLPPLGKGILAIGGFTKENPSAPDEYTRQAYFWNIATSTWIEVDEFNLPSDSTPLEGIMFQSGNTLILSPMYYRESATSHPFSHSIFTKDLDNLSSPWVEHTNIVEKGWHTQFVFYVDEYVFL